METRFPTFRRWAAALPAWAFDRLFWLHGSTRARQRSLLRLILAAHEESLDQAQLAQLIEAWADDEPGKHSRRLQRLAGLVQAGTPLPNALEEVRGVLSDEDVLAIRFGFQSGAFAATVRDQLEQPISPFEYGSLRARNVFPYVTLVVVVGTLLAAFWMVKIVPTMKQIFEEFAIDSPPVLQWTIYFANIVSNYWFLFALAILGLWLLFFTSWPGRRLRLALTNRFFRPARELRFASVLQSLSVAAKTGRPIAGALSTLARYHFDPLLRNQLLFIRNELDHGASVWQSMGNVGLLTAPEVRALESSECVGDRAWVLQQLAELKRRRTRWRIARWAELALPAAVLLLGAFVLWQALSLFQSLVNLIYSAL